MPSPCTVTATLADISGNAPQNSFLRFRLRGFQGFVPRVLGTAVMAETQIDAAPAGDGTLTVDIYGNDNIDPSNTWYTVEYWSNGRISSSANFLIIGTSFDLDSAAQLNPPPNPGGSGAVPLLLKTNGVKNGSQIVQNLHSSDNSVVLTDDGAGNINLQAAATGSGSLSLSTAAAPSTLNISTEGTKDWCALTAVVADTNPVGTDGSWHWKMLGGFLRRSMKLVFPGGTSSLSALTDSTIAISASAGDDAHTTGTVGTDNLSSNTHAARINANTNTVYTGWGFTLEAPADTATKTLRIYMGLESGTATVTARLSDGSVVDQTTTVTSGASVTTYYTITVTYKALSSGQRLNLSCLISTDTDSSTGIIFQAATLA
jgi:hypothetical protein